MEQPLVAFTLKLTLGHDAVELQNQQNENVVAVNSKIW